MESKEKSTKENFYLDLRLRLLKFFNLIFVTALFACVWFAYYGNQVYQGSFYFKGDIAVIILFAILYYTFGRIYDSFKVKYSKISELIYSQALALLFTDGIMFLVVCLLCRKIVNILPGFAMFGIQIVLCGFWCYVVHKWCTRVFAKSRTVIIYDQRKGLKNLIYEYGLDIKFDVKKTFAVKTIVEQLEKGNDKELKDIQTVFLTGVHSHERNVIIKFCVEHNIKAFIIPRIGDLMMMSSRRMHMFHLPMLLLERYKPDVEYTIIKRALDILFSLIMIIVFSPFMIITAIAVKTDGGPVFYKQERLTRNGKIFKVLKFRSMRVDAEKDGKAVLSSGDKDPRITKVGRIIRAIRFDELPQLFNILSGDMSIVGPRPERPQIHEKYCKELPEFNLRLQCKAGLTGYAQVYGKYNTTPYDKLLMDLMYISKPSIAQDLAIMFATVKIIFMKDSTEGIANSEIKMFEE